MQFLIMTGVIISIIVTINYFNEYDDTDNEAEKERSGLNLFIDNRTGLHYIKGGLFGNIIPRLDANGKQIRDVK